MLLGSAASQVFLDRDLHDGGDALFNAIPEVFDRLSTRSDGTFVNVSSATTSARVLPARVRCPQRNMSRTLESGERGDTRRELGERFLIYPVPVEKTVRRPPIWNTAHRVYGPLS